jgi:hypothetical protein
MIQQFSSMVQKKDIHFYLKKLPECLVQEIYWYIVPEPNTIQFKMHFPDTDESNYNSSRYEAAFIHNQYLLCNNNGLMLSRIIKKNNKHRFYITKRARYYTYCDACGEEKCRSNYCGRLISNSTYTSTYVGKNLEDALFVLFLG